MSSRLLERPMLPHPTSRSAPDANAPPPLPLPLPDLALLLEQHVVAGFPADLALDLVLNELVARAADATHATAAALALLRGKQMVCRAATGLHAPDLGVPLETRGLSGACVRSRAPQLSEDTESDPRVDPAVSRRLGIRSMLVVPVFDHKKTPTDRNPPLTGVLEVFSPLPNTFTPQAQILLTDFADECARIHNVATTLKSRPPVEIVPVDDDLILSDTDLLKSDATTSGSSAVDHDLGMERAGVDDAVALDSSVKLVQSVVAAAGQNNTDVRSLLVQDELAWQAAEAELLPSSAAVAEPKLPIVVSRQPYEIWTLILGGLVILAAAAFSFMIGSRIGWLRSTQSPSAITAQPADSVNSGSPTSSLSSSLPATGASAKSSAHGKDPERTNAAPQNKKFRKIKFARQVSKRGRPARGLQQRQSSISHETHGCGRRDGAPADATYSAHNHSERLDLARADRGRESPHHPHRTAISGGRTRRTSLRRRHARGPSRGRRDGLFRQHS